MLLIQLLPLAAGKSSLRWLRGGVLWLVLEQATGSEV